MEAIDYDRQFHRLSVAQFHQMIEAGVFSDGDRVELYPDLAILKTRADFYRRSNPRPTDVHVLIEVSDSSLRHDLKVKLPIYARHGVPLVWILDIPSQAIRVFQEPNPSASTYRQSDCHTKGTLAVEIAGVAIDLDVASLFRA